MDLYEYQGKDLFRRVGIPVSDGRLATTVEEARNAAGSAVKKAPPTNTTTGTTTGTTDTTCTAYICP